MILRSLIIWGYTWTLRSLLFILYPFGICYFLVHILCSFIHIYVQFHILLPILTFFTCYFLWTLRSLNLSIILLVSSLTIESYNGRNWLIKIYREWLTESLVVLSSAFFGDKLVCLRLLGPVQCNFLPWLISIQR